MGEYTTSEEGVKCPWCGYVMGDAWEWVPRTTEVETECDECGKSLVAHAEYEVTYHAKKVQKDNPDA